MSDIYFWNSQNDESLFSVIDANLLPSIGQKIDYQNEQWTVKNIVWRAHNDGLGKYNLLARVELDPPNP